MNQETIENHIKSLSKSDFDSVLCLILNKIFGLSAIDVDGKGDGGSDFRCFHDSANNKTVAIQKTTQEANWQSKAIEDAQNAKETLAAKRFYFLTSRARESTSLLRLEDDIFTKVGIPAKCFGATELAGLIVQNKLLAEFAHAINLPLDIALMHRPDQREIMLHSYFCLSNDRKLLQNNMYDKAIMLCLYNSSTPLERGELVRLALEFLGTQSVRKQQINGRVDALMGHAAIVKNPSGFVLGDAAKLEMQTAGGIYESELAQLSASQFDLLKQYNADWDLNKSSKASVLLARCFVEEQVKIAKHASLSFVMTGFGNMEGESKNELKSLILESHVVTSKVDEVLLQMVDLARDTPLINKLINSIVYVALEHSKATSCASVLGVSNWRNVKVILDSSVAIPYICTRIFGTSTGRFSSESNETIQILLDKKAHLKIPWVYLNECASHLVAAMDYVNIDDFDRDLEFSENGYVSHYYQLKNASKKVPETLAEFVKCISPNACLVMADKKQLIRKVMQELQPLFEDNDVPFEDVPRVGINYTKDIQTDYVYTMENLSRKKSPTLVDHDVNVLGHMWRCYSERNEKIICLTWDAVMIGVSVSQKYGAWVASPIDAADLIQATMRLGSAKIMSLAHAVARATEKHYQLGARIVDRAVSLASDKMECWEFRQVINKFKDEAIRRVDIHSRHFNIEEFDKETDKFLSEQGVIVPVEKSDNDFDEV